MVSENDFSNDSASPSFYPPRPLAEIDMLHKLLCPLGTLRTFKAKEELNAVHDDEKYLYLFPTGHFTFIRAIDGLVLSSVRGRMIFGLAECLRPRGGWFLKVEEDCKGYVVPYELAKKVITEKQLWETVASFLAWSLQIYSLREEHLVGVTAYVMVRNKLLELYSQAPDLRSDINAADFIQERTQLARSTIMAILGELRRGDYIEIKRGKLVAIRHLPKEY